MISASGRTDTLLRAAGAPAALDVHACPAAGAIMRASDEDKKNYAKPAFRMAGTTEAVIEIDGLIGGSSEWWSWEPGKDARTLGSEIKQAGSVKTIRLKINSEGGKVTEGTQMYNVLQDAKSRGIEVIVEVGATCMSAATLVACAGSKVLTAPNSIWMFHNPSVEGVSGEAKKLRETADALDTYKAAGVTIYQARQPSMTDAEISTMLDSPKYLTGVEAVEAGWADGLLNEPAPIVFMKSEIKSADLSDASDAVKHQLSIMMMADAETEEKVTEPEAVDAEIEQVEAPTVETLSVQLASMTETVNALAALVESLVPDAPAEPEQVQEPDIVPIQQVDRTSPVVRAIAKRAKSAGREQDFEDEVAAGATITQLQQSFLGQPGKPVAAISTVSMTLTPKPGGTEPRKLQPTNYYARREAAKKGI